MVYCRNLALYGLFQVALMVASLSFAQVQPTTIPIYQSYQYANSSPFLLYVYKHIFEQIGFTCVISEDSSMPGYTEYILDINFGEGVRNLVDSNNTTIQNVGVSGLFIWQSGGLVLNNGVNSDTYQIAVQTVLRFHRIGSNGKGIGDPYYLVFWNTLEVIYEDAVVPSVSNLSVVKSSYCLPFALDRQNGYILYPFNSPAFPIQVSSVLPRNPEKVIDNFKYALIGYSPVRTWQGSGNEQFYVVTTNYDYATKAYFINANQVALSVTGIQGEVSPSALNWPTNNYINSSLSIGGAISSEGFPTRAGLLDYDSGGQYDLSEWIVNKNRNDPTDDNTDENNDPEVNPPPYEDWPEGQEAVDLGKDTFERYEKYWEDKFGYYAPVTVPTLQTDLPSVSLTPFEDELEPEAKIDLESRTQGLESQIETSLARWQIYNDLKALIAPLEASAPFKYDFDFEYELPSLVVAPTSSSGGVSPTASATSSATFTPTPPQTVSLGSFSFDMSILYENTTVMSYIRKIRLLIHFVAMIMVFWKVHKMIIGALTGLDQSGKVTGLLS